MSAHFKNDDNGIVTRSRLLVNVHVREPGPVQKAAGPGSTHSYKGSVRERATCAGAAGSRPASEEGKLELTETLRSWTAVEGIPEGFHLRAPWKGAAGGGGARGRMLPSINMNK